MLSGTKRRPLFMKNHSYISMQQDMPEKLATQTAAATNMIFSMYITIPVILGVVITILLGLMKVERK